MLVQIEFMEFHHSYTHSLLMTLLHWICNPNNSANFSKLLYLGYCVQLFAVHPSTDSWCAISWLGGSDWFSSAHALTILQIAITGKDI